jgi:tetratricopeptide (TPR) repeat protein
LQYNKDRERYLIHELLRQYGAEKLAEDHDQEKRVRDRHSAYYCASLHQREPGLRGGRQQAALAEIEADVENARAAWAWAVVQKDVDRLQQAMDSLGYFHEWRGRYLEGQVLFQTAGEALQHTTDGLEMRALAKILAWQSLFNRVLGNSERVHQLLRQSLGLLDNSELDNQDTRLEQAFILLQLGNSSWDLDLEMAISHLKQSLALSRAVGDRWGIANALESLSYQATFVGNLGKMQQYLAEALALRRTLNDQRGTVTALERLSLVARYQGQYALAEQLAQECHTVCQEIGDQASRAIGLDELGTIFWHLGKFAEAAPLFEESVGIYNELGNRPRAITALWRFGQVQLALGRAEQARTQFQLLLNLSQETGDRLSTGEALLGLGQLSSFEGAYTEAERLIQKSVAVLREAGSQIALGWSLAHLGLVARHLEQVNQARQYAYESLQMAVEKQDFLVHVLALRTITLLLADQGKQEQAVALDAMLRVCSPWKAHSRENEVIFGRHIAAIVSALPPDVAKAAQFRGRELNLWEMGEALLEELTELGWGAEEQGEKGDV